jgi:hypothetical protein
MGPWGKREPETEVIDRQEEENGDYSFTFIMTYPAPDGDDQDG